jgi:DinB superfamily
MKMEKAIAELDAVHQSLLETIEPLTPERFSERPSPDRWSVAEIVHHLYLVERSVLGQFEGALSKPPVKVGLIQRLLPVGLLVGRRVVRVKAPKGVEPLNPPSKEETIANFNQVRESLKEFSARHGDERLQQLGIKHPIFGTFDAVSALRFVSLHELRHFRQIREVMKRIGNN